MDKLKRGINLIICDVKEVYRNYRYKLLVTSDNYYIVDMWHSYLKILFPFLFWMLPTIAYKLNSSTVVEELKNHQEKQSSSSENKIERKSYIGWGAIIGFLLVISLKPLSNYFLFPESLWVNVFILSILVLSVFTFVAYLCYRFQKNIYKIVNLKELRKEKIWIKPKSLKTFLKFVVTYLFFLMITINFIKTDIKDPDIITQVFTVFGLLFCLASHALTLPLGQSAGKFKTKYSA